MKVINKAVIMKWFTTIFIAISVLLLSSAQTQAQQDGRYSYKYPGDFFSPGGSVVEFDAAAYNKIGVLVTNHTARSLSEITRMIFSASPFDR